jgi:ammonium transporter, Amt family
MDAHSFCSGAGHDPLRRLAIFYGCLARQKNAVNTLHMVFITNGVIAIQWGLLWGYSLAFGPDAGGYGFIGTLDWAGLQNVLHDVPSSQYAITIPHGTFMVFQMMFAIITPALIVALVAERMMKYRALMIFIVLWRRLSTTLLRTGHGRSHFQTTME